MPRSILYPSGSLIRSAIVYSSNLEGRHHFTGYITESFLANTVTKETICYVGGPVPFLKNVVGMLDQLGVPAENIRFEFFGPAMSLETKEKVEK